MFWLFFLFFENILFKNNRVLLNFWRGVYIKNFIIPDKDIYKYIRTSGHILNYGGSNLFMRHQHTHTHIYSISGDIKKHTITMIILC